MSHVSVIIPVFDSVNYLQRCLTSILNQDYDGVLDIILVDDGSTDASGDLCDYYAQDNAIINVFHIENQGASLARRFGLEKATGEYVTFIDSDDYVSSNYISKLLYLEKKLKIGISACKVLRCLRGVQVPAYHKNSKPIILEGDSLFSRFFKYEFWGLCGKMYQRSLLVDIPFPKATLSEDYYVTARLLQLKGRMAYIDEDLYFYEQHSGSLSKQPISARSFEEFTNVKDVFDFTAAEMPKYESYALSNAVETAVKLLVTSRRQATDFVQQRQVLKDFLASHRRDVLSCKPLNHKVRLLALALAL